MISGHKATKYVYQVPCGAIPCVHPHGVGRVFFHELVGRQDGVPWSWVFGMPGASGRDPVGAWRGEELCDAGDGSDATWLRMCLGAKADIADEGVEIG